MKKIYKKLGLSVVTALLLSACGSSDSSNSSSNPQNRDTGYLIDSVIEGARYINADGTSGFTKSDGSFPYTGGVVEFYVGKLKIGSVNNMSNGGKVFLQDILGLELTNLTDSKLLNIAQFLQSLDTNQDTDVIELDTSKFNSSEYANKTISQIDTISELEKNGIAVKDMVNVKRHLSNALKQYSDKNKEQISPRILSISPTDSATNVLTSEDIIITFSEDIKKETLLNAITLKDSNNKKLTFDLKIEGSIAVISPKNLEQNAKYSFEINDSVEDYSGNILETNLSNTFRTISGKDLQSPVIFNTSADFQNVSIDNTFVLSFSEKLDDNTVNGSTILLVDTITNKEVKVSITHKSKRIIVKPVSPLIANSKYSLKIQNINDLSGNKFVTKEYKVTTNNTITHNDFEYNVIKSPITGRLWLDRNIGAKEVCDKVDNEKCYGDYFQWGRKANGHEKVTAETIDASLDENKLAKDVQSNGKFALWSDEWRQNRNDDLWKGAEAVNNPCPVGFKVPNIDELLIETKMVNKLEFPDQRVETREDNMKNFLKLPSNGMRKNRTRDGIYELQGYSGNIWSSSTSSVGLPNRLTYYPGGINAQYTWANMGYAVRCMQDYSFSNDLNVTSTTPSNNAVNVLSDSKIRIEFSNPVISSLTSSSRDMFEIKAGDTPVVISTITNINNHIFDISLDNFQGNGYNTFKYDTTYTIKVKKEIFDVSDTHMKNDYILTFKTQKDPINAPALVSNTNINNSFVINENIRVSFSKDLKESTILSALKFTKDGNDEVFTYSYKDRTLTINPTSHLDKNTQYVLEINNNLQDTNDISFVTQNLTLRTSNEDALIEDTNGNIYKEITSNGKTWLDRNIGATKVCENLNDKECFGDYFTFEESKTSCPTGYKLPSALEINDEMNAYNRSNFFDSALKVPVAGKLNQNQIDASSSVFLWTSTTTTEFEKAQAFTNITSVNKIVDADKNNQYSLRCIK